MGGAISLSARNTTSQQIVRLWNEVGSFEDEPSMEKLSYPPHFTFAIYERVEMAKLEQTVRAAFADQAPLRIVFDRIRYFDVSPLVLWASPSDDAQLTALHATIHRHIDPVGCSELYRPDCWIPHCTLGNRVQDVRRSDALAFVSEVKVPFEVVFDTVDWVSFPPLEVAGSHKLLSSQ